MEVAKARSGAKDEADKALTDVDTRLAEVRERFSPTALAEARTGAEKLAEQNQIALLSQIQTMVAKDTMSNPAHREFWQTKSSTVALSIRSLTDGALDGATNFFAGWANTFTFGGYGALMRYTGGSYFINTGSTAYSSGSLIGGIHQSLLTGNAMTSYSCATWIGKIARLGELFS